MISILGDIGRSLDLYGEWSEGEVALFQALLRPNDTVVEVGANIGSHSVFFAKAVGAQGNIVAIEPQRVVFQTLCANLALNSLTNTYCYQLGLGTLRPVRNTPLLRSHQYLLLPIGTRRRSRLCNPSPVGLSPNK